MNLEHPASNHDLLTSTEQQIEMSGRMFSAITDTRFYLLRTAWGSDNEVLANECKKVADFLSLFQVAELNNLKQWCNNGK